MGKTLCVAYANGNHWRWFALMNRALYFELQKLTVSPLYRNLVLPMNEDKELSCEQMVVPVAAISMKDGECYKNLSYITNQDLKKAYKQYSNLRMKSLPEVLGQVRLQTFVLSKGRNFKN